VFVQPDCVSGLLLQVQCQIAKKRETKLEETMKVRGRLKVYEMAEKTEEIKRDVR
jgi:hypothetical protein